MSNRKNKKILLTVVHMVENTDTQKEREEDRERQIDRQTHTHTDTHTYTERETETDTHRKREGERKTDRHTHTERDRQTHTDTQKKTDTHTHRKRQTHTQNTCEKIKQRGNMSQSTGFYSEFVSCPSQVACGSQLGEEVAGRPRESHLCRDSSVAIEISMEIFPMASPKGSLWPQVFCNSACLSRRRAEAGRPACPQPRAHASGTRRGVVCL